MNPTFLLAVAALAAGCACLAIVSWRKCVDVLTEVRGIASSLRSMRGRVEAHDGELEAFSDALRQLRGKFYSERRKSQTLNDASTDTGAPATTKEELRRRIGLVPGKPAPHRD